MLEAERLKAKQGIRNGLKPDYEKNNSGVVVAINGSIFADVSKHRIWVQPVGTDTTPVIIFSDDQLVDLEAGTEVIYAQDPEPPEIWRFVKVNRSAYSNQVNELGNLPAANLTKHALEHTVNQDFVGSDPMMVYGRMIARFNVQPTNPETNKVLILPGSYAGDTYHQFITKIRVSSDIVTGNVPSTSNMAALVAISQDSSGSLTFTKGTEFSKSEEVPPIYCYPDVPAEDELLALIYLEQGDTTVTNSSFRFDQSSIGSGGGRSKVCKVYTPDLATEVISTDSSGQVGIGTTSPSKGFHVVVSETTGDPTLFGDGMILRNDNATGDLCRITIIGGDTGQSGIDFADKDAIAGQFRYDHNTNDLTIRTNATDQVYIDSSGQVGIGESSPSKLLHIDGGGTLPSGSPINATAEGIVIQNNSGTTDAARVILVGGDTSYCAIDFGDSSDGLIGQIAYLHDGNLMKFYVNNAYAMTIDSSQQVGIGTESPSTRLDVADGAIEFEDMTEPAAGAANTGRLYVKDNGSGKSQLCVRFATGAVQVLATEP